MIEEGREWEAHCKTRVHRRLASKGHRGSLRDRKQISEQTGSENSDTQSSQLFT